MPVVVKVRINGSGQTTHYNAGDLTLAVGDHVIVETEEGNNYGIVSSIYANIPAEDINPDMPRIVRRAESGDAEVQVSIDEECREALQIAREMILEHGLDMDLSEVSITPCGNKMKFYFTAEKRVDFRELVKDLAARFQRRIELRQIGVRDETGMVGGMGVCGRELCCSSFLNDFRPVSIKMAKTQNVSINPSKISGACGRLLCCLGYEQEAYEDARTRVPNIGSFVLSALGVARVENIDLIKETVTVKLVVDGSVECHTYSAEDVELLKAHDERIVQYRRQVQATESGEPLRLSVTARRGDGWEDKLDTARREAAERRNLQLVSGDRAEPRRRRSDAERRRRTVQGRAERSQTEQGQEEQDSAKRSGERRGGRSRRSRTNRPRGGQPRSKS
ncbi:MAG: stage 0 sporulation protein [Clostridiaceae bacterium]|nr:stage 0 sporulation protein [Clostridiaceae bacterium]